MTEHGDDTYRYGNIRLNFSSNVYNHFDHSGLFQHLSERMGAVASYPEPTAESLERAIAEHLSIPADCVMVTNGATEAIYLIAQTFGGGGAVIPQPTFSEYSNAAALFPENLGTATHWLCNPNNPTGLLTPKDDIIRLLSSSPETLFILDHSYEGFTSGAVLTASEALAFPNALVIRSMTKDYAIPGLRLGYITGNAQLLEKVRKRRMPWSVNALAIIAGHYLLQHRDGYVLPLKMLLSEAKRVAAELEATGNITVFPSDTHILLCRLKDGSAQMLKEHLANNCGILIRHAGNFDGLDDFCFRIAVQRPEENDELIREIKKWNLVR